MESLLPRGINNAHDSRCTSQKVDGPGAASIQPCHLGRESCFKDCTRRGGGRGVVVCSARWKWPTQCHMALNPLQTSFPLCKPSHTRAIPRQLDTVDRSRHLQMMYSCCVRIAPTDVACNKLLSEIPTFRKASAHHCLVLDRAQNIESGKQPVLCGLHALVRMCQWKRCTGVNWCYNMYTHVYTIPTQGWNDSPLPESQRIVTIQDRGWIQESTSFEALW